MCQRFDVQTKYYSFSFPSSSVALRRNRNAATNFPNRFLTNFGTSFPVSAYVSQISSSVSALILFISCTSLARSNERISSTVNGDFDKTELSARNIWWSASFSSSVAGFCSFDLVPLFCFRLLVEALFAAKTVFNLETASCIWRESGMLSGITKVTCSSNAAVFHLAQFRVPPFSDEIKIPSNLSGGSVINGKSALIASHKFPPEKSSRGGCRS
mmetsp:Transcript_26041/g.54334  ORF Transcript_26041/g.54334 Transcript_26041/m.54334 type:complete len:214 (-) Transcript_26041:155-796(-)